MAPSCPACRAPGIPLLYGLPSPAAFEAAEQGLLALGGCVPGPYAWACSRHEEHQWGIGEADDAEWDAAVDAAVPPD